MKDINKLKLLKILPKKSISRICGFFTRLKRPKFCQKKVINWFIKTYNIDTTEIVNPVESYNTLASFFLRHLKDEARPINNSKEIIVSPVDAKLVSFGKIRDDFTIPQIKDINYPVDKLIINENIYSRFKNGFYSVLYLSPADYHRIHSPYDIKVKAFEYVPGKLFPVNSTALNNVPSLFCINERVTSFCELNDTNKHLAIVKVGAFNVGMIPVDYIDYFKISKKYQYKEFDSNEIAIKKGIEFSRFEMGSTIVMLSSFIPSDTSKLEINKHYNYGEALFTI